MRKLPLVTLLVLVVILSGCPAVSDTTVKRVENAADVAGYTLELEQCRDVAKYPTQAAYEACAELADARHAKRDGGT